MSATATTAQEEFDNLVASRDRVSHHPDDASDNDADSDTLVDSTATTQKSKSKSSLRSGGAYDGADSSDADSDSEARLQRRRPSTYSLPKRYAYNANTGPKGVIADAQAFELEKGIGNKRTYVRTEAFVLPKNQRVAARKDLDRDEIDAEDGDGLGDDLDDEDDEVMRKWREMRVSELKRGMLRRQSGGGRRGRYGTLQAVDAMGFLEAVDNVPKGTVVVVFVFDDELPISDAYQTHITTLASKYADIRFIALHFEEAEMEHAGVPAVLAYRDGDQFASLVPLKDEVSFTRDVVTNMEEAFRSHRIL